MKTTQAIYKGLIEGALATIHADLMAASYQALVADQSVKMLAWPHVYPSIDAVPQEGGSPAVLVMGEGALVTLPDEDNMSQHKIVVLAHGNNPLGAFLLAGAAINALMNAELTVAGNTVQQPRQGSARLVRRDVMQCCVVAEVVLNVQPLEG